MADLTSFNKTDLVDDHTAADYNKVLANTLRAELTNTATISATLALSDIDLPYQVLTASGANQNVKMPVEAITNHIMVIYNGGGSNNLVIQNSTGGTTFITLAPGQFAVLYPISGQTWKIIENRNTLKTYFDTLYGTASFWTLAAGTPVRTSNTTFTVTGDYTNLFRKGMIIKWTETGTTRWGMVSIPSTFGSPNTTITIIGNTMASIDASSLKYALIGAEPFEWKFSVAGTIGATGTDVANARYAEEPMIVIGADLQVGTVGTTNNTTVDINKGGTTMFTTKPTLATTVASSPTPFTADTATTLALGDKVTLDIDAVQTTAAIDLYATLYVFPARYEFL